MKFFSAIIALSAVVALVQAGGVGDALGGDALGEVTQTLGGVVNGATSVFGAPTKKRGLVPAPLPGALGVLPLPKIDGTKLSKRDGLPAPLGDVVNKVTGLGKRGAKGNVNVDVKAEIDLAIKACLDGVAHVDVDLAPKILAKVKAVLKGKVHVDKDLLTDIKVAINAAIKLNLDVHLGDINVNIKAILDALVKVDLSLKAKAKAIVKAKADIKALVKATVAAIADIDIKALIKLCVDLDINLLGLDIDADISLDAKVILALAANVLVDVDVDALVDAVVKADVTV
ncbi:hypothetical protein BGX24_006349 [Mortierella sp. AD032]|nr:hypothetical protein BGX24_006349 [Mortierella sp. AD032]